MPDTCIKFLQQGERLHSITRLTCTNDKNIQFVNRTRTARRLNRWKLCIKRPSPTTSWEAASAQNERNRLFMRFQLTMNLKWSEIELLIPCFDTFFVHRTVARREHRKPIKLIDNVLYTDCIWLWLPQKSFLLSIWKLKIMENGMRKKNAHTLALKHGTFGKTVWFH